MFRTKKRETVQFQTPQEMYDDYKNRKINGIQDYQSKMLDAYIKEGIDKKDVALELPTGTGKTLIGLLIGEFRRRKNREKVVYICPTSQLVYQTVNYANEKYGIKALAFTGSKTEYNALNKLKYETGESIAITNYSSIFNINSFFNGADVLIFDDAHSGENYISSNWTVEINRNDNNEVFAATLDILRSILTDEQFRIMSKEKPGSDDRTWCDMIHNSKLAEKYNILLNLFDEKLQESSQKYSWQNINNHLYACNIYLAWERIIIRPYISPTLTCNVFANAKTRIYMSATLGNSGELERSFGVEKIHKLPMVKDWKNKEIGRRFFMFPFASFEKEDEKKLLCRIAKKVNRAVILVNDLKTQDNIQMIFREQKIGQTFNGKSIERSKSEFVGSNNAYAIIANRFDGIDFPDEECRVLVLFDIPTVSHIQEKFLISRLSAKTLFEERIKTRIIQAIGRCNRSQTDYAAICVLSEEVMSYLLAPKNLEKFNPELQAEIRFGYDNSVEQNDVDEYLELLDIFLKYDDDWEEAEESILATRDELILQGNNSNIEVYKQLKKSAIHEVKLQYALWKSDYENALQEADNILCQLQVDELKGYRGYWNYIAGCCALELYRNNQLSYESKYKLYFQKASESTMAVNWFRYEEDNHIFNVDYADEMLIRVEKILEKKGNKGTHKFYSYLDNIMSLLKLGGLEFETGYELLGEIAGFRTTNPKGSAEPDPIWIINRELCIVSENKIYKEGKLIPPNDVKEAAGHVQWVNDKREDLDISDEAKILTVFITTATSAQENTTLFGKDIYYLHVDKLILWAEKLINVIKNIYRTFSGEGDSRWREETVKMFREYEVTPYYYINLITEMKLTDL